ncbi:type I glyceraldehyde-3-phosphate dehydrogenase [Patescibacteria group bacterium]|nr:type I glyceraldehyde-3-phosphate dehydrogenase [Patescibacteria group bacterium]
MIKLAINGFGRIGRVALRAILNSHPNLEVAAINDLADEKTLRHLFKYDSVYGRYDKEIGKNVKMLSEKDPAKLPWKKLGIDAVLECSGVFRDIEGAKKHLHAGAKKVIISAPAKSEEIPTFVLGVNEENYDSKKDDIVSMASCTTNCLAPVAKVLNDNFKIIKGFMTTAHSYTNDQRILDLPHKDLRRARAAALNMIPTSTGAALAIGKVIPELNGKLDGIALRVPTPVVSVLDLVCQVGRKTDVKEINSVFNKSANKYLKCEESPLVSSDFIGSDYSAIIDAQSTMVQGDLVKVLAWYDNEWGYACRLAEFAEYIGKSL